MVHSQGTEHFLSPPGLLMLPFYSHTLSLQFSYPYPWLLTITNLFISVIFPPYECYVNGIIQSVTLWDWLFSLSTILWRFNQDVIYINSSFLLLSNILWFRYTSLFNQSLTKEHLGFQFFVIMIQPAMNICAYVLCECKFSFFLYKCPGMQFWGKPVVF